MGPFEKSDLSSLSCWSYSLVEVAKFWLKIKLFSKLLAKLLKVHLSMEAKGEREKDWGGGGIPHADKFSNKKHIFIKLNCSAVEQSRPQGPKM